MSKQGVVDAESRIARGEDRGVELGDVLAEAVGTLGDTIAEKFLSRADRAALSLGHTHVFATGDAATPQVDKANLFDVAVWDEAMEETENLLATAVIDEMGVIGVLGTIEQPFVASVVAKQLAQVEAYGEAARAFIGETLDKAFLEGATIDETAKMLREGGPYSKSSARLVARTEMISASNGGARVAYMAIAEEGDTFTWLSTSDDRTRKEHKAVNGQEVGLNEPFEVGGEQCMYPGDAVLTIAMRGNCRCSFYLNQNG